MSIFTRSKSSSLFQLICSFIATCIFLVSGTIAAQAQLAPFYFVYAGAGGNDYYAGDNNDALTAKFSSVKGVAVDGSGNVLVTDYQNACIRKIGTDGKVSVIAGIPKTPGSSSPFPSGPAATTAIPYPGGHITVASNGDIYFMANGFSIGKISNGNLSYFIPAIMSGTGSLPRHSTIKALGNYLYLGSGTSINVIDLATQKQVKQISVPGSTDIKGVAVDANGDIYCIGTSGQLSKINGTTNVVTTLVAANADPDLWVISADLAVDASGNLFLASNFSYILKIAAGTYTRSKIYGDNSSRHISIAMASNGDFYTADQSLCKIFKVRYLQTNYYLSSLAISTGSLNTAFVKTTTSYTVTLANDVDKISVTPTVDQANATVKVRINGGTYADLASGTASPDLSLNVGSNTINILVTAQSGYTLTYTITVTRQGLPPDAPVNLAAVAATNSVRLTWDAVPGATRYKVYRGTSSGNLTLMAGMPITATSFTDNTATVGVTYYYAVSAIEVTGVEGAKGTEISGAANNPPVIANLTVSGNFWVGQVLTANYDYTDVEGSSNASTYRWYRSNNAAGSGKVAISGATAKTYTLLAADEGKYVSVRVYPNDGITAGTMKESGLAVVITAPLPVKLVSFKAKPVSGAVLLNWQTVTEINSLHFAIERSTDGRTWETAGIVGAAGDSYMPINYAYTDRNMLIGRNYYRLKTVDRDGYTEFSNTVQVDVSSEPEISLYPVPATNSITIKGGNRTSESKYVITDGEGKTVKRGLLIKPVQQIDIQELKQGIYFLKIENKTGVRFIKQ